jgi:hypothetical protein
MSPRLKSRRLPTARITARSWWRSYVELADGRCAYCHAPDDPLTLEHIAPLALGGTNLPDNLLPVCSDCNHAKGSLTLTEFVAQWHFASAEGIPHPLGQIVSGEWVWSDAAREIQRAAREARQRRTAGAAEISTRGERARVRALGDLFYELAYAA